MNRSMNTVVSLLFLLAISGCDVDQPQLSSNADELFWITSHGADMPVWVKGNTASGTIVLIIHGGPGATALWYEGNQTALLRERFAVAFWDQRDAGASQGNNNFGSLGLDQMVSDCESIVAVLRHRYGSSIKIALYAHSFGGLLSAAFLTKGTNQQSCIAWIDIAGAHSYPLTGALCRQMLLDTAVSEIAAGRNTTDWQTIVDYCLVNQANTSLAVSLATEGYAEQAEALLGVQGSDDGIDYFSASSPLSTGVNLLHLNYTDGGKAFLETLESLDYTSNLHTITIPSLLIWGAYDFTVPRGVADTAFTALGSSVKKLVVLNRSGHAPMRTEPEEVNQAIVDFIRSIP